MHSINLLRLANLFSTLASSSKNIKSILKQIDELDSFNSKKEYAEDNLKHLSSGSSRLVYLTCDNTVIKLAKNDKGIEQNKAESKASGKCKYLNSTKNTAKDFSWIEVAYFDKISSKQFEDLLGFSFNDFCDCIKYSLKKISDSDLDKPKCFDKISKSEFFKEIIDVSLKFKLMPGDLVRISSWGTNGDYPILLDAGLTKEIYDKFYD